MDRTTAIFSVSFIWNPFCCNYMVEFNQWRRLVGYLFKFVILFSFNLILVIIAWIFWFAKFTLSLFAKFEILKAVYMWNVFRISCKYAHNIGRCIFRAQISLPDVCRNPIMSFNGKLDSSISLFYLFFLA